MSTDGFRHNAKKRTLRIKRHKKPPDAIAVYVGRKIARTRYEKTVAKIFNAIVIPNWHKFSLRAYGHSFRFNGYLTKRYSRPAIIRLFGINEKTLWTWLRKGIMPEPMMRVAGTSSEQLFWFYHQVQPVYVWYMHMRSRGITRVSKNAYAKEVAVLKRHLRRQEIRFLKRVGYEVTNDYEAVAGKYGVFPDAVDNSKR